VFEMYIDRIILSHGVYPLQGPADLLPKYAKSLNENPTFERLRDLDFKKCLVFALKSSAFIIL